MGSGCVTDGFETGSWPGPSKAAHARHAHYCRKLLLLFGACSCLALATFGATILVLAAADQLYDSAKQSGCFATPAGRLVCPKGSPSTVNPSVGNQSADSLPAGIARVLPIKAHAQLSDWQLLASATTSALLQNDRWPEAGPNSPSQRIAFLFLVRGPIPLERIWERFLKGHEDKYSIYVHSSEKQLYVRSNMATDIFVGRGIPSKSVRWGQINVVDAERRLLARALLEPSNHFFVLVSETCAPIRPFAYVYDYLLQSQHSFVDVFVDEGPFGLGRYLEGMGPEIPISKFMKGAQWFAMHRRHATAVVADSLYYQKFRRYCRPGNENHNCYPDEHYLQTFLHMMDPTGISNTTVTHVDWSARQWHPKTFHAADVTVATIQNIQRMDRIDHPYANEKPPKGFCFWNGIRRPCFLFARKFDADVVDDFLDLSTEALGF